LRVGNLFQNLILVTILSHLLAFVPICRSVIRCLWHRSIILRRIERCLSLEKWVYSIQSYTWPNDSGCRFNNPFSNPSPHLLRYFQNITIRLGRTRNCPRQRGRTHPHLTVILLVAIPPMIQALHSYLAQVPVSDRFWLQNYGKHDGTVL
jgi:hypothetical protein